MNKHLGMERATQEALRNAEVCRGSTSGADYLTSIAFRAIEAQSTLNARREAFYDLLGLTYGKAIRMAFRQTLQHGVDAQDAGQAVAS